MDYFFPVRLLQDQKFPRRSRRLCCGQLSTPPRSHSVDGETETRTELLKIQKPRSSDSRTDFQQRIE
ncbi:hypothetical protein SRHO_G00260140 [Serrasalmus rhombeus]